MSSVNNPHSRHLIVWQGHGTVVVGNGTTRWCIPIADAGHVHKREQVRNIILIIQ